MTSRSRHTTKLHKARRELEQRERITELERAFRRLQDLHDVSKLLTSFESVERTVPRVLSVVARSLALRNAIFLLGTTGTPMTILWHADSAVGDALDAAKAHAANMYDYLLRARSTSPGTAAGERAFVMLPLVVDHLIFGALQVEGMTALDVRDLTFVGSVVNQLAIAVDRAAVLTAQRVAVEVAEKRQHVLADLGAGLVMSRGSSEVFAAVARAVVPRIADLCLIAWIREDGAVERLAFATDASLVERLEGAAPSLGDSVHPMLVTDLARRDVLDAITDEVADVLRAAGVRSIVAVPLFSRGRSLGAMTLGVVRGRYSEPDLSFAIDLAGRIGPGIDNTRLHEQTRRDAEELRHAVQLREDVLAIVSHDLRNPLSAVDLSVSSLVDRHGDDPRSRAQLETVRRAISRMGHLVDDLLDMASIQTGRFSLDRKPSDAAKLATEILDDLEPTVAEKGIRLERELDVQGLAIRADRDRIAQVFGNLVGNARKFGRAGDVIRVGLLLVRHHAQFLVEDTGPGIPEAELPRIFEPYWSAKRHERQGTGLGLYICKGIIEAHGGRLWVESKVGVGTKFFFEIPLARD